jgi:hypothetical protein
MACLKQLKFEGLRFPIYDLGDLGFVFTIPFVHFEDVSESFIPYISKFVYFDPLSVLFQFYASPVVPFPAPIAISGVLRRRRFWRQVSICCAPSQLRMGRISGLTIATHFPGVFLEALGHQSLIGYPCDEMRRLLYRLSKFLILCSMQ